MVKQVEDTTLQRVVVGIEVHGNPHDFPLVDESENLVQIASRHPAYGCIAGPVPEDAEPTVIRLSPPCAQKIEYEGGSPGIAAKVIRGSVCGLLRESTGFY